MNLDIQCNFVFCSCMEDGSTFAELLGQIALAFAIIHKWYIHYIHHVIRNMGVSRTQSTET